MSDEPDDGSLAAEYVLGTLDRGERAEAEALRMRDNAFAASVAQWEERLAPLIETGRDVSPPPHLWQSILTAITRLGSATTGGADLVRLQRRVVLWRRATGVVTALAAALAVWIALGALRPAGSGAPSYMAVLQQGAGGPAFLVSLDLERRQMTVVPVGAPAASDKSYELWMIAQPAAPKSLGIIDAATAAHPVIRGGDTAALTHATYAVTLEPRGGSPTGQPTSSPIFVGHLIDTRT